MRKKTDLSREFPTKSFWLQVFSTFCDGFVDTIKKLQIKIIKEQLCSTVDSFHNIQFPLWKPKGTILIAFWFCYGITHKDKTRYPLLGFLFDLSVVGGSYRISRWTGIFISSGSRLRLGVAPPILNPQCRSRS